MSPILSDSLLRPVCSVAEAIEGEGLAVEVDGEALTVWKLGEEYFVTSDTCSHGEASLSGDGFIEGFEIVCGLHMGSFDIRTGEAVSAPCYLPIKAYTPVIIEDRIYIRLSGEDGA